MDLDLAAVGSGKPGAGPALLKEIMAALGAMDPGKVAELTKATMEATKHLCFIPTVGPQLAMFNSLADICLYGGQGGGGKSAGLAGLALTQHKRSLLMRREYTDLGALIDDTLRFHGTRDGFNGSSPPKLRTKDGRLIEFGAAKHLGDEQSWMGQPHDLLGFDEAVQFLEAQIRFLMGWVRSATPGQRCRVVMATNPPITASGQWLTGMFRPWLDITHPRPAQPGDLRWFITTPDGKDMEVNDNIPVQLENKTFIPRSRTFIPATLADNPFLADTGYQAQLDALPEPYRSAVRDGNFMAARKDAANQVIPVAWVLGAQQRWSLHPPKGVPMCSIGVDASGGGEDPMVLAPRYDGWFAEPIVVPGKDIPMDRLGAYCAGIVVSHRRDGAIVVIDMGGGYGGPAYEQLKANGIETTAWKGAEKSTRRTADKKLTFVNKRSEMVWRFREALDPSQPGGSPIALPDSPTLMADLTSPTFEITSRGIKIESKVDVVERLGRSPDEGDAVMMAWAVGPTVANQKAPSVGTGSTSEMGGPVWPGQRKPEVILGHQAARRR